MKCPKCEVVNQPFSHSKVLGIAKQFESEEKNKFHYHDETSEKKLYSCDCGNRYDQNTTRYCWCGWPDQK